MANENANGENPGADDGAGNQTGGKNTGGGAPTGNTAKKETQTDDDAGAAGQVVFKSKAEYDAEVNRIVSNRLERDRKKIADDAKLTETQRLEKERDEANQRVAEADLKDSFIVANSDLSYANALKMFRYYRSELDVDDKGKITNLADIQKQMKQDFKPLFPAGKPTGKGDGAAGAGAGKAATGSGGLGMDEWLKRK